MQDIDQYEKQHMKRERRFRYARRSDIAGVVLGLLIGFTQKDLELVGIGLFVILPACLVMLYIHSLKLKHIEYIRTVQDARRKADKMKQIEDAPQTRES